MQKYYRQLPELVKDTTDNLFLTHNTSLYRLMTRSVELTDLVSRYAMYTHEIQKGKTHNQAIQVAAESLVDYNIPTNHWLQAMNDYGFMRYTKYYIRIQKILARILATKSERLLVTQVLDSYLRNAEMINGSLITNKMGNLVSQGALDLPQSFTSITPIDIGFSLLN